MKKKNSFKKSRRKPNKIPEILIDLEHFRNVFAQRDEIGILLGGRYQIYNILFDRFVAQLMAAKVRLSFFVAVHEFTDELSLFIPKMEAEYYNHIRLMDNHSANAKGSVDGQRNPFVPLSMQHNLIALIKKRCARNALHYNYYRHTQEIIQYANANADDILAIISNDLHLLLFESAPQFWYANDINFETLSITLMCRKTLEIAIDLNAKQMQLLSVLIGSPYLPAAIVDSALAKCDDASSATNKIQQLANYIRRKTHASHIDLRQIAMDISHSFGFPDQIMNAIENGQNCFDTGFTIETLGNDAFIAFSKDRNPFIYTLMIDDVYLIKDIAFIDYRYTDDRCSFAKLAVPLIQKMIGILFKTNAIKPMDRKICMKFAHDEPYRVVKLDVIYPEVKQPDVFALIYKNREQHHEPVRWSLLKWMFLLPSEFNRKLTNLPNKYVAVVLTLYYLCQVKFH